MKLALESRTDMLDMVQPFADFDWILGHKVLEDEEYARHYADSTKVKFVDNSVNEVGEPLLVEDLRKIFDLVGGSYVVSPDWVGDKVKTIVAFQECSKEFGRPRTVGVVQGSSFEEALGCAELYGPGWIAVPYDVCSKKTDPPWLMAMRRALVVCNIPPERHIHLLGFTSLEEFYWYTGRPEVVSMDTGVPVLLGLQGKDILEPLETKEVATYNQMEQMELTQTGWTAICRNIALLRRYLP